MLSALLWAPLAHGQVNIEVVRGRVLAQDAFASIEAGFTGRLGNVQSGAFTGTVFGGLHRGRHYVLGQATGDYAEFFGAPTVARAFGHGRYNYAFTDVVLGEAFAQVQSDLFQRLRARSLFGFGPRFALLRDDPVALNLGTSLFFEEERLIIDPGSSFPEKRRAARVSTYASAIYRMSPTADLATTVYAQPRVDDAGDIRVLSETSLSVRVTPILVARISATLRYQSRPPPGVVPEDFDTRTSLGVTF
jgi:hypothetical protein